MCTNLQDDSKIYVQIQNTLNSKNYFGKKNVGGMMHWQNRPKDEKRRWQIQVHGVLHFSSFRISTGHKNVWLSSAVHFSHVQRTLSTEYLTMLKVLNHSSLRTSLGFSQIWPKTLGHLFFVP